MEKIMKVQEHYGKAEEFAAEAHKLPGQGDSQDIAAVWAAVAVWGAVAEAGRESPEDPAPGIVPPGVPKPRLPGVGPLPGP
jgi:hypothetical protein